MIKSKNSLNRSKSDDTANRPDVLSPTPVKVDDPSVLNLIRHLSDGHPNRSDGYNDVRRNIHSLRNFKQFSKE